MRQLQAFQNKAAQVLLNLPPRSSSTEILDCFDLTRPSQRDNTSIVVLWWINICWGKFILILTSDAIVVFILIKLGKRMIYSFRVCVQTFIYQSSKDWKNLDNIENSIKIANRCPFLRPSLRSSLKAYNYKYCYSF